MDGQEPPSRALVLALVRGSRPLPAPADWDGALAAAGRPLLPFLDHRLSAGDVRAAPPPVRDRLHAARRAATMAHAQRQAALTRIVAALGAAGHRAVFLKGVALAHLVYPDAALRTMQDIDVWVAAGRLGAAADALERAGFRFPDRTVAGRVHPVAPHLARELCMELPDTRVLVELHDAVPSLATLDSERVGRMWDRAASARLGGVEALVLRPDDLLLHLCLHCALARGFSGCLPALLDVTLVIERWTREWDWEAMAADYRAAHVSAVMRLTLGLARDLLAAPVPPRLFDALPPPAGLAEMDALAREQIWNADAGLPTALEHLVGETTWRRRARWLLRRLSAYGWTDEGAPPGAWARAREWGRRFRIDLATKLPRYGRLWRLDDHSPGLRRRLELARRRQRLKALVDGADAAPGRRPGPA